MSKGVEKKFRSSSLDKPHSQHHSSRPAHTDIEQEKIYQQTKDEILFWSKKLRVSPSQLFTLPEDHLDELLAAAYEETIRNDMQQEQIKRLEDMKRLEEIKQLEEMQREEEAQKYEHMKRLNELQQQEEMQLQQKMARVEDFNRPESYQQQRNDDLDTFNRMKRMEDLQRQEEFERQKEIQRLEKIQIQQVLHQKQQRREQRMERLKKLSQIKNQFVEQQSSRLRGGGQQGGRSAWEILHDAALEIEASYGPLGNGRMVGGGGGAELMLPALMNDNTYEEKPQSAQKKSFEEPTFHIHNAKFDITLPKT